ncbi:hypothetical protein Pan181_24380 [Aeoliella mucimassa]|uniref:Uncharacterized protein n=1 Tax=Aeoliella mucimassa TaxID=2527972 RepID=A0A518ANE0_9BACT|nr:hypothetical protein Pan181_24380 [Aeoliella mucimassa]
MLDRPSQFMQISFDLVKLSTLKFQLLLQAFNFLATCL